MLRLSIDCDAMKIIFRKVAKKSRSCEPDCKGLRDRCNGVHLLFLIRVRTAGPWNSNASGVQVNDKGAAGVIKQF